RSLHPARRVEAVLDGVHVVLDLLRKADELLHVDERDRRQHLAIPAVRRCQQRLALLDVEQRKALLATAYGRYREVLPTIPLVHVKQLIGLSKKVEYDMHPIEYRFYTASWVK